MINLGIDASTTTVGFSILKHDMNGSELLDYGYIKPDKNTSVYDRALDTVNKLMFYIKKYNVDNINMESMLKNFKYGRTSTDVLIMLAEWNLALRLLLYIKTKKLVYLFHPTTARKLAWGTIFHKVPDKKMAVLEKALEFFPELIVSFPKISKGPRKGAPKDEIFDVTDSITLGMITLFDEART